MANWYVRSGAAGTASGADWTNAKLTLAATLTAAAAGDDVWVSEDHAESTVGAVALTSPGTESSPCRIACVNHSGTVPPVSADLRTTGTITCTGNNTITISGTAYWEGLTITAGGTTDNANLVIGGSAARTQWFNKCKLALGGSNTAARITIGNSGGNAQRVFLNNTTVSFASTSHKIVLRGAEIIWENTSGAILGSVPTTLISPSTTYNSHFVAIGVDLSAAGSGKTLVDQSVDSTSRFFFQDCKYGSSVSIGSENSVGFGGTVVLSVNSDSADTTQRYYYSGYEGTVKSETTIVKSGGATDGATPVSRKMVSLPNTRFYAPLKSGWIAFWSDTTGSKTASIAIVTDNVTLKDNEIWIEVEYLGTSGFPLGLSSNDVAARDRAADILNAGTNQTTDATSSWPSAPGTPVKQTLSTTFTTTGKGQYRARVCLAKASTTVYFDPLIAAGSRQFMLGESGYINQEPNSGGTASMLVHPGMSGGARG